MTSPVITVKPRDSVRDVAALFVQHRISAAPVVDEAGKLVGIISEGDLLHRVEIGTEQRHSRWLRLFAANVDLAAEYLKSHARTAGDVMTREVITAEPDTPLHQIATTMEKKAIKRVPVLANGQLVGIVSRANLVQALATSGTALEIPLSDSAIRDKLMAHLKAETWSHASIVNATVRDGVVDLWGMVGSPTERRAIHTVAQTTPGVRAVNDHLMSKTLTYGV
jgi:CBS domain-containing protein